MKIYLFTNEDCSESITTITHLVYLNEQDAKDHLQLVRQNYIDDLGEHYNNYTVYSDDDMEFNIGIDGSYCEDHLYLWIEEVNVLLNSETINKRQFYTQEEVSTIISNVVFDSLETLEWKNDIQVKLDFIKQQVEKYQSTNYQIL